MTGNFISKSLHALMESISFLQPTLLQLKGSAPPPVTRLTLIRATQSVLLPFRFHSPVQARYSKASIKSNQKPLFTHKLSVSKISSGPCLE